MVWNIVRSLSRYKCAEKARESGYFNKLEGYDYEFGGVKLPAICTYRYKCAVWIRVKNEKAKILLY